MSDNNEWPRWLLAVIAAVPAGAATLGPKLWTMTREWRGDTRTARTTAEDIGLKERVQLAAERDAAFGRSDAEMERLVKALSEARQDAATQMTSGQRWYAIARAWWSRAWDKLGMARRLRDDVIEAREGWATDRRGWFEADPTGASAARRPEWMGPPPDFMTAEPPVTPDPPELEKLVP
jgi:hypothetical protein